MDQVSDIIIPPAAFVLVGFVVWTIAGGMQQGYRLKRVIEFNSRLLDRLGSVKDFAASSFRPKWAPSSCAA